jgi:hypothetical protein
MEALTLANKEMSDTKSDSNPLLEEFCKGYFAFFIRLFRDKESQKSPNPTDPALALYKIRGLWTLTRNFMQDSQ